MKTTYQKYRERKKDSIDVIIARCGLVLAFTLLIFFGIALYNQLVQPDPVHAVGNCREGEVRVRHRVTGKCNCLPANAVANPWEEDDSCSEDVDPTQQPVPTKIVIVNTPKPLSTAHVLDDTPVPTNTPIEALQTIAVTQITVIQDNGTPTPTSTVSLESIVSTSAETCDTCELDKQQVDALIRIADALEKLVGWVTR